MSKGFFGKIAKVMDGNVLIINKGFEDGVSEGDKFLVFGSSEEEVKDPDTGKVLGKLIQTKGEGEIFLVQEKMAYLRSTSKVPLLRGGLMNLATFAGTEPTPGSTKPFKNPKIGDKIKKLE